MALLTPTIVSGSANPTLTTAAAAAGGDTVAFNPSREQVLVAINNSGASINVTVTAQRTTLRSGDATFTRSNTVQAVAAGTTRYFPMTSEFADANGLINIGYSAVTSVLVGVLELDF